MFLCVCVWYIVRYLYCIFCNHWQLAQSKRSRSCHQLLQQVAEQALSKDSDWWRKSNIYQDPDSVCWKPVVGGESSTKRKLKWDDNDAKPANVPWQMFIIMSIATSNKILHYVMSCIFFSSPAMVLFNLFITYLRVSDQELSFIWTFSNVSLEEKHNFKRQLR